MPLSIVGDENVACAREAFGRLGEVRLLSGRKITREELKSSDILIVRSITQVDAHLLTGSAVRFVGTATIGYDHVDRDYLDQRGVAFASAPGSNANSVAEYVMAALLLAAEKRGIPLEGSSIAIVGVGNVGSRVAKKAEALGMKCLLNDPPKQRATADPVYISLGDAVENADYVTLHVPLERKGPDATVDMADRRFFRALRQGAVFLNTSRGQVVVEEALAEAIDRQKVSLAILDVWQNEPEIDEQLVRRAFLGTAHIAGYSYDGKVNATLMVYQALCEYLQRRMDLTASEFLPPPEAPRVDLSKFPGSDQDVLREAIRHVYDIRKDDRDLRRAVRDKEARGKRFDLLRKAYPHRREFHNTELVLPAGRATLARKAEALGFKIEQI